MCAMIQISPILAVLGSQDGIVLPSGGCPAADVLSSGRLQVQSSSTWRKSNRRLRCCAAAGSHRVGCQRAGGSRIDHTGRPSFQHRRHDRHGSAPVRDSDHRGAPTHGSRRCPSVDAQVSPAGDDVTVACLLEDWGTTPAVPPVAPDDSGNQSRWHPRDRCPQWWACNRLRMPWCHDAAGHQEIAPLPSRDVRARGEGSSVDAARKTGWWRRPEKTVASRGGVAVWGSSGSPGRSTVARDLAWTVTRSRVVGGCGRARPHRWRSSWASIQETSALVAVAEGDQHGRGGPH